MRYKVSYFVDNWNSEVLGTLEDNVEGASGLSPSKGKDVRLDTYSCHWLRAALRAEPLTPWHFPLPLCIGQVHACGQSKTHRQSPMCLH